jgi:hypothetical protein
VSFLLNIAIKAIMLSFNTPSVEYKPIVLSVIMLSVNMLSIVMLSVVMVCVIMLSVIMLSIIMLSVITLSVITLTVVMLSAAIECMTAPNLCQFKILFFAEKSVTLNASNLCPFCP